MLGSYGEQLLASEKDSEDANVAVFYYISSRKHVPSKSLFIQNLLPYHLFRVGYNYPET